MSSTRLVRGTKSRFFLYVCAISAFLLLGYVIHGNQTQLEESKKATASCLQQQESLSAQLQVIFEYKLRLEKSLQKEKVDHREMKEALEKKLQDEKQLREKEAAEATNKYNALEQHHKLLQSKNKDLTEECNKLRKIKLEEAEEKSKLEELLESVRLELDQTKQAKDKSLESLKTRFLQLENENEKLRRDNAELTQARQPEPIRVQALEKQNMQLNRELEDTKKQLESLRSGVEEGKGVSSKVSIGGPVDSPAGLEPPKFYHLTGKSTTPVINPEAVIEHDASSLKPQLPKSTKASVVGNASSSTKQATQVAAAPIQMPMNQDNVDKNHLDLSAVLPESNVIRKPTYENKPEVQQSNKHTDRKVDDLNEENQGGEIVQDVLGPMNPVQSNINSPHINQAQQVAEKLMEPPGNSLFIPANRNVIQNDLGKENLGFVGRKADINGAHEEGEDEAPLGNNWRVDENKELPKNKPEYQGGDYDKPEEEGITYMKKALNKPTQ